MGTAVSVITGQDIELRGYDGLADVLRTQPGVAVSSNGGAGKTTSLRIRGEEGYRTLVMLDGVKIADPTAPQVGPSFDHLLTTNDLARVEILRGPQGFLYGADAGGVVNILTRTGEGRVGGQAGLEVGDFATRKIDASLSGGSETGDYFFSATDVHSDGFNTQAADTVLRDDDGYENTTLHTKLGWNINDRIRLQLVGHEIDARNEFDGCGFPTTYDCVGTTKQKTYRASADLHSDKLTHSLAYSSMDVEADNFADGVRSFATDGRIGRSEYTGSYKPTEATTLVYGLELQREEILTEGEQRERGQDGYYFEYQGQLGERFFVSAGARYDDNDDFGTHTSTRVSAAYLQDLAGGTTIKYRASVGTGFRAPSLFEIAYNGGPFAFPPAAGVDLTEEISEGYDIGVDLISTNGLLLELTYFNQQIDDEIFFDLAGFSGYLQSPGTTESQGIEAAYSVQIASQWELLGNLTYNDTKDTNGMQRIRRPKHFGNIGAQYSASNEKLRLIANYRFSRDAVDEIFGLGRVPLDDYGVFDISASYAFSELLQFHVRVENLTDASYQEVTGFTTPGRTATAGVRLRF